MNEASFHPAMRRRFPQRYTRVAVTLHWIIALLFLGSYASVYFRHWFTVKDTPANWTALQLHLMFGVTIAAFVVPRLIWRWTHRPPPLPPGPDWEHAAARGTHFLLYAFMIAMPVSGYISTGANVEYLGIPMFKDTGAFQSWVAGGLGFTWDGWRKPIHAVHTLLGESLVWVLILIHTAAALYHQYWKRDNLLRRMWF